MEQSHSHHSRLLHQAQQPRLPQKPVSYHTMYSGIHRNGFQQVQSPSSNIINSVNIKTSFR